MYLVYSILYFTVLAFVLPFEYLKRPWELRSRWLWERFGRYGTVQHKMRSPEGKTVWIHAVSVGEVISSIPLVNKLKDKYPANKIVVSTVTDTGQKVARERIGYIADIIYMPFDIPFSINKAVAHINPSVFVIMETELWPNIIRILHCKNIPVVLMNGRISEKSFGNYQKMRFFMKQFLKYISLFCMQNDLYSERIKALGAEPGKVKVAGSFKFDTKPLPPAPEWNDVFNGPVIIGGSTHRSEEDLIIDAYARLLKDFPELNLIIAPRHPERFNEVEELIKQRGLKYIKRSELADGSKNTRISHEKLSGAVMLLDVIGELASVYSLCDIAIMGGSFIKHGGQNPLEPAYWGKAIICGPNMDNFPFIDNFYQRGGAIKADSDVYDAVKGLLDKPEKILSMGSVAKGLYNENAGAVDRALGMLASFLRF